MKKLEVIVRSSVAVSVQQAIQADITKLAVDAIVNAANECVIAGQ